MLKSHYEDLTNFLFKKKYLTNQSFVLEVGSNSGNYLNHLSQYVKDIIGIDPAKNIVDIANKSGIKTIILRYFNVAGADKNLRTGQIKKNVKF